MLKSWFSSKNKDDHDLFPRVNPKEDGPDCLKDCADCSVHLPGRFHVDTQRNLYGKIKPISTHLLVATGRSDWQSHVEREKGSLMEALDETPVKSRNGRLMVSASNLQVHRDEPHESDNNNGVTTVLLLPSFIFVDNVTAQDVPELITRFVDASGEATAYDPTSSSSPSSSSSSFRLISRPCVHDYIVLLCSHKRRDARCGISAPLIKRELERHLRPVGLYRDADDERPGGVGIYFVSHVGGHKFSANVLVYRKKEGQLIWLARVRPEHCEGVVRYTILKGKVVHPESQLRGGFDRSRGLTSW